MKDYPQMNSLTHPKHLILFPLVTIAIACGYAPTDNFEASGMDTDTGELKRKPTVDAGTPAPAPAPAPSPTPDAGTPAPAPAPAPTDFASMTPPAVSLFIVRGGSTFAWDGISSVVSTDKIKIQVSSGWMGRVSVMQPVIDSYDILYSGLLSVNTTTFLPVTLGTYAGYPGYPATLNVNLGDAMSGAPTSSLLMEFHVPGSGGFYITP